MFNFREQQTIVVSKILPPLPQQEPIFAPSGTIVPLSETHAWKLNQSSDLFGHLNESIHQQLQSTCFLRALGTREGHKVLDTQPLPPVKLKIHRGVHILYSTKVNQAAAFAVPPG